MKRLLLFVCLLLLTLRPPDAPGQPSAAGGGEAAPLRGSWVLVRFMDGGVEQLLGEARISLCFAADGAMTGETGLNHYKGSYAADPDGSLRWPRPFSITGLAGAEAIMRLELVYMPALFRADRWQISATGPELRLAAADGKTTLAFRKFDALTASGHP